MKSEILARDLMVRPVRRVTSRTTVRDAAEFLGRSGIGGAPVEDEHGRWIGVFSLHDVAGAMTRPVERSLEAREEVTAAATGVPLDTLQVRDVMTPGMITVFPGSTLAEIIRTFAVERVHRVFVIDEHRGTLEGVITPLEVLRHLDLVREQAASARA